MSGTAPIDDTGKNSTVQDASGADFFADPGATSAISDENRTVSLFTGILNTRTIFRAARDARPAEEEQQDDLNAMESDLTGLEPVEAEYELENEIARGGQGYIRRALDRFLGRTVAVKTLDEKLAGKSDYRSAFLTEAQVMAQLDHPAIVPVYGLHSDASGGMHLAMKLVQGKNLKQYLSKVCSVYRTMPRRQVRRSERRMLFQRLDIFLNVCAAIRYVHYRNVIHRDLKPENIMIGKFNETYVMDWGIAEFHSREKSSPKREKLQGTPQYIAPEIINHQNYDSRSDIYSLGLILFEIVYLKAAYGGGGVQETLQRARRAEVERYSHAYGCSVDKDLEMIVRKALEPDPAERYQNVKTLAADLRNYREMEEVSANPDGPLSGLWRKLRQHNKMLLIAVILMFLGLLASAGFALYRHAQTQLLLQEQMERQTYLMRRRDAALNGAYSKGVVEGEHFNLHLKGLESQISNLAHESALLLQQEPRHGDNGTFYDYTAGESQENAPPNFKYAPTYRQNISFDTFVYKTPDNGVLPELNRTLNKLAPLRAGFFRALTAGEFDDVDQVAERAVLEKRFRTITRPSLGWVYLSLVNGLHLSYPYHSDYDKDYDPRRRLWYLAATKKRNDRPVWSLPYIDNGTSGEVVITCSQPVYDDSGTLLGVVGGDVNSGHMREIMETEGNIGPFVKNKMLVDESGRVIIDMDRNALTDVDGDGSIDFRLFDDLELLRDMRKERNGRRFRDRNGVRYLYFYIEVKSLNWLYIVQIDYAKLLASAVQ